MGLTVSEKLRDFGHIRVVLVLSLDEDILTGVYDRGTRQSLDTNVQRASKKQVDIH